MFICRNCIGNALEFFIDACEANKGDSNAAVQLPLHLLQSLDIITNCLTIESVQAISVKEQEYDNHNQSSQDNGKNSINLRHKYTRK